MKEQPQTTGTTLIAQSKDTSCKTQLQTIFQFLQDHVATASMVTDATNVPQKCITRYKRDLEKAGLLWEVEKKDCQKTGFKAWYLTTNPAKAPKSPKQLDLFAAGGNVETQPSQNSSTVVSLLCLPILSKHYFDFETKGGIQ